MKLQEKIERQLVWVPIFFTPKVYPDAKQDCNDVIIDHVEEIAKKYGATSAQIVLAWHFTKPYVISPIVGVSKREQLYDLIGAMDIKLTKEEVDYLEEPYNPKRVDLLTRYKIQPIINELF